MWWSNAVQKLSVTESRTKIESGDLIDDGPKEDSFWEYDENDFFDLALDVRHDLQLRRDFSFSRLDEDDGDGYPSGGDHISTGSNFLDVTRAGKTSRKRVCTVPTWTLWCTVFFKNCAMEATKHILANTTTRDQAHELHQIGKVALVCFQRGVLMSTLEHSRYWQFDKSNDSRLLPRRSGVFASCTALTYVSSTSVPI